MSWSTVDRVLLVASVVSPLTLWYLAVFHYLSANSDVAPYIDREVLAITIRIQTGLVATWLSFVGVLLAIRRHTPAARWCAHALVVLYVATIMYFTFLIGPFTSMFLPVGWLAGIAIGLIMLDESIVLPWIVIGFALIIGMVVLEQLDWIPYAPLLLASPFESGNLQASWILTIEGVGFSLLPIVGGLFYFVIGSWHARERELLHTKEQLTRANAMISRYVPAQLAAGILANDIHATFKHERRRITVFFSDVRNFSEIADRLEPEEMSRILNEYLSEMTHIGERHGGTLEQYYGDGILIYFGAPTATNDKDHALRAIRMGLEMLERVRDLSDRWQNETLEHAFEIRIGINTGYASVGNYGTAGRMAYMAVGRPVNLAARLQSHCEPGRILISHATWLLVRDEFDCAEKGELQVKGSHLPIKVYEVCGEAGASSTQARRA